jgi:hypothetical protein
MFPADADAIVSPRGRAVPLPESAAHTTPLLSESGGPFSLEQVPNATDSKTVRTRLGEACNKAPDGDHSDSNFTFWSFEARQKAH